MKNANADGEGTPSEPKKRSPTPVWVVTAVAKLYHRYDQEMHTNVATLIAGTDRDPEIKVPKGKILAVIAIIAMGIVISYIAPQHVGQAFWIGALSINTAVAGGLLAFAPLLADRIPDIGMAMITEAVEGGLLRWQNGMTPAQAFDQLKESMSTQQVWLTLQLTGNGLLLLMLNIVGFAVMIWLPASTRIGVTSALVALLVYALANMVQPLYGLRLWPTVWIGYRKLAQMHAALDECPVCRNVHAPSPEPLALGPGTTNSATLN